MLSGSPAVISRSSKHHVAPLSLRVGQRPARLLTRIGEDSLPSGCIIESGPDYALDER